MLVFVHFRFGAFFIVLLFISLCIADYSDVLLVTNNNSSDSLAIADYFTQQRNITHRLNISITNSSDSIKFGPLNSSLLQPVKTYLNATADTINYIVLSKDIPLWTDETDYFGCGGISCANSSSVDTELMLMNTAYEQYVGQMDRINNPYYGASSRFSKASFGIYLVTRLDAFNVSTVYSMINKSANMGKADRDSGLHIITRYLSPWTVEFAAANQTLSNKGLNVYYNSSSFAQYPANQSNVSYFDTFGCYNFGGCNSSYMGRPNYTWKNGSFASARYSYSARTVRTPSTSVSYIADYLEEGATAGLGYAVEPLTSGIANPLPLATNYVNNFRMAELLWSSVPQLSWSAVVFGDPKAGYASADVVLTPSNPTNTSNLTCSITPISDFDSYLNISYEWYRNGTNMTGLGGSIENAAPDTTYTANLSSGNLSVRDRWHCRAIVYREGQEVFSSNSSLGTIGNSGPATIGEDTYACGNLASANTIYVLRNSVNTSSGNCFTVQVQNITLDCDGYRINATPSAVGVYSGQFNTTIRNCIISTGSHPGYGIYTDSSSNSLFSNITITTNNSMAVNLKSSSNCTISNITATINDNYGFYLWSSSNYNTLENITITTLSRAIYLHTNSSYNNISHVSATGGSSVIHFTNGANFNKYSHINATSTGYSIYIDESSNNTFINITATNSNTSHSAIYAKTGANDNTFSNITATSVSGQGISLYGVSSNTFSNVTATSNSSYGIRLSEANFTNVTDSIISSNSSTAVYITSLSDNNTFLNNNISGSKWVYNDGTGNTFNNSSAGNIYYFTNGTPSWQIYNILDTNGNNWADTGASLPFNQSTVSSTYWSGSGGDYHPYTMNFTCGNITAAGAQITLTSSLVSNATCFNISAENVTINCAGHTITGNNTSSTYGIYSNQANTTITNCIIQNFSTGIFFSGVDYGAIDNSTASTTNPSGSGIYLYNGANYNTISNSTSSSTSGRAIYLSSSDYNNLTNITATSTSGYAIDIGSNSDHNTLSNITATSNSNTSIYLYATSVNTLSDITATSNTSYAIYLYMMSSTNTLSNIIATSTSGTAICISTMISANTLTNVTATSTSGTAMSLIQTTSNTFTGNKFISGSGTSVSLTSGAASNTFLENNITGAVWVSNGGTGNLFNNSTAGNIYYFNNSTPSWVVYDILDTDGDNWADAGSDSPFNSTTVGSRWPGTGNDYHPYVVANVFGNGSNISTTGVGSLLASVNNSTSLNGRSFEGNQSVNISSGNNTLVYFYFNFSNSSINFSKLNITNGTSNGAQYFTFSGMETGMLGKKTVYIYEANTYHNSVCIDDRQNVSLVQITHDCTETDETLVTCDGSLVGAYTCTRTGNTLAITGLTHSGIVQFHQASSSASGSSNNAGGSFTVPIPPAQQKDDEQKEPEKEKEPVQGKVGQEEEEQAEEQLPEEEQEKQVKKAPIIPEEVVEQMKKEAPVSLAVLLAISVPIIAAALIIGYLLLRKKKR